MVEDVPDSPEFDFEAHRRTAEADYQRVRPLYELFSHVLEDILEQILTSNEIGVASVQARAKTVDSLGEKAATPSDIDPRQPKYPTPLRDITDLAGARIITFFPKTVSIVDAVLAEEFEILEKLDKADLLLKQQKLGYQSVHYIVRLRAPRASLPEYERFAGLVAEVQVRTILQHAWAEIEHDIQYKSLETIPVQIGRRFMALAGLLEIADREFQAIQDEDEHVRQTARRSVNAGQLEQVEITADALKSYLDKKLGPDGRMSTWSYEYVAKRLRSLKFQNFQQIDECIAGLDDDHIGRILMTTRQGQLTRFEYLLLVGMGERFLESIHDSWLKDYFCKHLATLSEHGVTIRTYDPAGAAQDKGT